MYEEIINNLKREESISIKDLENRVMHLGIFTEPYLSLMLNGKKIIESRFSKNKIAPYNQISKNDIVIVKKSGGDITAYFKIKDVIFFDLSKTPIKEIKEKYSKELCVSEDFWKQKAQSNYATLIFIDKIIKVKPFPIHKKGMQTWIVLNKEA